MGIFFLLLGLLLLALSIRAPQTEERRGERRGGEEGREDREERREDREACGQRPVRGLSS